MELTYDELRKVSKDKKLIFERYDEIEKWATKLFFKNFLPGVQLSRKIIRGGIYFYIDKYEFRINSREKLISIYKSKYGDFHYEDGKWEARVYQTFTMPNEIHNVRNYLCENMDVIDVRLEKIKNLLCKTHYIRYLPLAYTFLLCNSYTHSFPRGVDKIIVTKILFFLFCFFNFVLVLYYLIICYICIVLYKRKYK